MISREETLEIIERMISLKETLKIMESESLVVDRALPGWYIQFKEEHDE